MNRRAGFTISELLVSVAVLAVVTLYLTNILTRQSKAYTVVDQVTEVQQNVRAIAGLLEREMRTTAYMTEETAAVCGADSLNAPDTLFLTDADAVDFTVTNLLDLGAVITGGYNGTGNNELLNLNTLAIDANTPSYDTNGDNVADSDFRIGAGVIVVDKRNPERGASCGIITQAPDLVNNRITVDFQIGGTVPLGLPLGGPPAAIPNLAAVPANVYRIVNNQFLRNGVVLADDVEDLQMAFFFDNDDDGAIGGLEYLGTTAALRYFSNAAAADNRQLREMRVNFVVRTRAQSADPDALYQDGQFQITENRAAVPGRDGFRRRVYTATVRPRNVGERVTGS